MYHRECTIDYSLNTMQDSINPSNVGCNDEIKFEIKSEGNSDHEIIYEEDFSQMENQKSSVEDNFFEIKSEGNSDHEIIYEEDFAQMENQKSSVEDNFFEQNIEAKAKDIKKKKVKNASNKNKCSICYRKTSCPSALEIHMRCHTGETPYPCLSCDKKYKDQGSLKRHVDRHHSGERQRNYICEHCGKGFFSKTEVKVHMRIHTGETPYACTECPRKFSQLSTLIRHKRCHSGVKPYVCNTCGKQFTSKEGLTQHFRVHSKEKKYSCSICSHQFKTEKILQKHVELHSTPYKLVCNYCDRTFKLKGNLKTHIVRQHSEKSGHCKLCSKNVANIEAHMWKHTGQRPLKCDLCTSSFFDLRTLAKHVNYRHKNIDKYKCPVEGCGSKFSAQSMLEYHITKLHKTVIPFPCDRCSRGFYRKSDLARHKSGTHKEKLS